MTKITVVKRTGESVPLQIEKIQKQVAMACKGIADVSQSLIEIRGQLELYDGIATKTIDELLIRSAVNLIDDTNVGHVNYQYVAGRLRVSTLRKEVYDQYEPPPLYSIVKKNVEAGVYTADLLKWYSVEEWNQIDTFIDHQKDEDYSYSAIEQLIDKYLVRNRVTGQMYETPQVRYAVAAATAFHAESKTGRLRLIKDYYNCASDGLFTLATPVLAGLGTPTKQFSSCVLIRSDDTLKSIFAAGEMMADYASKRAGIGLEVGRLRPLGSPIRGGEIKHTGLVPFLKKWFGDLRSCSQGGIRNASATVTFPIWHAQFEDLIVLKNNQGTDETRIRHMDYSVVMSGLFWKRLIEGKDITLFDPSQVPDLYEAFYSDIDKFDKLYVEYEVKHGLKTKRLTAESVIRNMIVKERTDTGRIYLVFIDNVQKQGPFDTKAHPIYQSNLCFSGDTMVAVADGRNAVSMRELTEQGTEFNVYSAVKSKNNTRGIRGGGVMHGSQWKTVIRKSKAIRTGARALVRVHLADGDFFDTTPDHRLATTQYGVWVEALNSVGAMLEPIGTFANEAKYRGINSLSSNMQHKMIWEHAHGAIPEGHQIDHRDRFGTDTLDNLQLLSKADHLNKTRDEITGNGNNINRVSLARQAELKAKTSFLERNGRYSGLSDLELIAHAKVYAKTNKLTPTGLSSYFGSIGAPRSLSKNRFQKYAGQGFKNAWQYLIACANGSAVYHESDDYTTDTKFGYEVTDSRELHEHSWLFKKVDNGYAWQGRQVIKVENLGMQDCYDVQVLDANISDDEHNFYVLTSGGDNFRTSKGVLVHNCQEILLPTKAFQRVEDPEGRIALCTLGSINWGAFRNPEDMKRACRVLVRSLGNLLEYQDFLSIQSKLSNDEIMPLGVGVTNLAYWHAKRGLKYGEEEALAEVKRWMEHQAFFLTEISVEMAKERGPCKHSDKTYYGKGIFPWERRANGVNELTDFTPELSWEPLRDDMKRYGVRFATTMAIAPVESSSVVINSTNGIELPMALISVKESKGSLLAHVVPEYTRLKAKYQLMWEQVDCVDYIKTAAVLAAYVDQSISTNTFYNPKFFPSNDPKKDRKVPTQLVIRNLMLGYKWGLKTFYYSLINKQGVKNEKPVDEPLVGSYANPSTPQLPVDNIDDCEACKL